MVTYLLVSSVQFLEFLRVNLPSFLTGGTLSKGNAHFLLGVIALGQDFDELSLVSSLRKEVLIVNDHLFEALF